MAEEKGPITGVDDSNYEKLEAQFEEVLKELVGDKALQRFRVEYEKLFRVLKKSHGNEKRLIKKCRELNAEIVANAAKVQTALKLSEEDQMSISSLKKEVEKAWKMVDASHEKEARAKETICQLKLEITNLTRLVEQGAGISLGEEATVNDLLKQKEELVKELESKSERIMSQQVEITESQDKLHSLEQNNSKLQGEVDYLKLMIDTKKAEAERECQRRERLEKEARELKSSIGTRTSEIKQKAVQLKSAEEQQGVLREMLTTAKSNKEKLSKEYNQLNEKVTKLQNDLEEQIHQNAGLLADNGHKQISIKSKDEEISAAKAETARVSKIQGQTAKKLKSLEESRESAEHQRDTLKTEEKLTGNASAEVAALEKQLELAHKANEHEQKRVDDLMRERDILTKLKTQAENSSGRQLDLIKINEGTKRNLEQEIRGFRTEAQKQQRLLFQLDKEREKYGQEASESTSKHLQALEEVKLREMAIIDLQKKIGEAENKFKQQQNLYEAVRVDRNMYSKKLIESQDEIQEMKRKFKIMNHQIEQLKDEISAKDMALVKEHFDHLRVEKEKEGLRMELNKAKQQLKETDHAISAQQQELDKLNQIINEADEERVRQKKEYDLVMNERDILGTQLIRRNDELALLYEKIKILQSSLSRGQSQYRDRLNEIRILRIKLADLNRELTILKRSVADVNVLKREVHSLGRQLLQECTKVKALSEELENPLNVHRWRKLEGSDPSTFEMIQKIQTLQKRLITKTEEVVERDLLIQEKEKLYVELKNILARQPGPEVAEQLSTYQANIREKNKQMKSMASELNTHQAQSNEYKYEIERLTLDLNDMKKRYFSQKHKENFKGGKMEDKMALPAIANPSQTRYTGGGFSLATQPA